MKKKILLLCLLVLPVAALILGRVTLYDNPSPYTITKPFVFPELADTMSDREKIAAHSIAPEIVSQMTTDALLETFLTYPNFQYPFGYISVFYREWLALYEKAPDFGLSELMKREDLAESILKRYRHIPIYKGDIPTDLTWIGYMFGDEMSDAYKTIFGNVDKINRLELLAGLMDLTGDDKVTVNLLKEIEKKTEKRAKYDNGLGGAPDNYFYERVVSNEATRKKLRGNSFDTD